MEKAVLTDVGTTPFFITRFGGAKIGKSDFLNLFIGEMKMSLLASMEVIYSYTRAQALADGGLVDVTDTAKEAGFKIPVALTAAAWGDCVAWPESNYLQDEAGRLWDVLTMAAMAAIGNRRAQQVPFSLHRVPRWGSRSELVQLVMHIGPGDGAESVITIMQPGED